jgi:hypothetical protein
MTLRAKMFTTDTSKFHLLINKGSSVHGFAVKERLTAETERFLPHAVGQRLLSLRDILADSEFTLEIVNTYTVQLRQVHDRILMDDVMTGFSSDSEIQGIKRCRLYLQVECLSDIYTADGVGLDPGLQNKPPAFTSTSRIQWPCQGLPGPRSWATWRRFLQLTRVIQRPISYGKPWDHGLNPIFGLGIHTTTQHRKCSARRCQHQQRPRQAPKTLGTTIQHRSRTHEVSSQ